MQKIALELWRQIIYAQLAIHEMIVKHDNTPLKITALQSTRFLDIAFFI